MFQVTQKNGARFSAADGYLRPALTRPNLEVRTNVTVLGVELEGDRAVGVRLRRGRGGVQVARAEREVLLSAGAIGSPQLLLLSGIGPADELRRAGVEVRHELAGVGRNLQDHPFLTVIWEVSDRETLYGADRPKALGGVAAAQIGQAQLDRGRGGRVHPHARGPAGGGHPVPHGRRLLRRPWRGDLRRSLHGDRADARLAAGPRPGMAALGRPHGQAADHHEHAVRAR